MRCWGYIEVDAVQMDEKGESVEEQTDDVHTCRTGSSVCSTVPLSLPPLSLCGLFSFKTLTGRLVLTISLHVATCGSCQTSSG